MKRKILVLAVMVMMLLASCKMDLRGVLYVNDILETAEATETLYCPATISIEAPSEENEEAVTNLFNNYFYGTDNIRKEEVDGTSYMLADIKIPLVAGKNAASEDSVFSLAIIPADNKKLDIVLNLDRDMYGELSAEVESIAYEKLNLSDMTFRFTLNNDSRTKARFETTSVYANKKAYPYRTTLELDRRQTVEVKLSDVLRDQFAQTDSILIASLLK